MYIIIDNNNNNIINYIKYIKYKFNKIIIVISNMLLQITIL